MLLVNPKYSLVRYISYVMVLLLFLFITKGLFSRLTFMERKIPH